MADVFQGLVLEAGKVNPMFPAILSPRGDERNEDFQRRESSECLRHFVRYNL